MQIQKIEENKIYFARKEFYQLIRDVGGIWNDAKERPLVCLLKIDNTDIFWAIPMGNWEHRNDKAKERIQTYLSRGKKDIQSCYYHLGNTNEKSIFFISDVVPITLEYIERGYHVGQSITYEVKNPNLVNELVRKLKRILRYEEQKSNYFRQHITDLRNHLNKK